MPFLRADRFSASQKKPAFYGTRRLVTTLTRSPPPFPILSQINLVYAPHHTTWRSIVPSTPKCSKWTLSLRVPHQNPVYASPLPHMCYMPLPSNSSRFHHTNNNGWWVQIIKLLIMYFSPFRVTSSLLSSNILLNTPFSNTHSLCSSLSVSDQDSHPYKKEVYIRILLLSSHTWLGLCLIHRL